jgi:hypothetical protein
MLHDMINIQMKSTFITEAIAMWSMNHTAKWFAKLSPERREELMRQARLSVKEQRAQVCKKYLFPI